MTDQTLASPVNYLASEKAVALPAPRFTRGAPAWIRENLFSTPGSAALTLVALAFVLWVGPGAMRYLFIDAVWTGDGAACRAQQHGACWAFVLKNIPYFVYGSYPIPERWRVDVWLVLGAILVFWMLWPKAPRRGLAAGLFIVVFPFVSYVLLSGWTQTPAAAWSTFTSLLGAGAIAAAISQFVAFILSIFAWPVMLLTGGAGLPKVETNLWGGVFVSLLVSMVGIVFSLPAGVLLALGRRSKLPIIKFFSVMFIEFVRGVPLITVLFMANTMLPLFVPEQFSPDRLLRPLIGVAFFSAAYMAEVIRGGLQAMPKGQYEGAMALGLNYPKMMRLIILPQALTLVIPGIVNTFIGLFKDTTLVAIVGIYDFLKTIETRRLDPEWAGPTTSSSGYIFAAVFYFIFCFGMSRYSLYMERKLNAGKKR